MSCDRGATCEFSSHRPYPVIKYTLLLIALCLTPVFVDANPSRSGSSGLISAPSAETLDAGNICLGTWSCYSENQSFTQKRSLIMPVSMTLGIGTFWEVFSSYPNILFNGNEDTSGIGTLDIGTKLRFLGNRSSTFKMAAEFTSQRHVSENLIIDGVIDVTGRLIASYNKERAGVHIAAGYVIPGSVAGIALESGYTLGVGAEYLFVPRMKVLGEVTAATKRHYTEDNPIKASTSMELAVGIQYYLSPHLTVNVSAGTGLGPHDSGATFIFGLSSCQGVGSYVQPIPSVGQKTAIKDKPGETLKTLKIIPISRLLIKASASQATPSSNFEMEVNTDKEEFIVKPFGDIMISPQQASSNLTSPVIPVDVTIKAHDEDILLLPYKEPDREAVTFDYIMSNVSGVTPLYSISVKGATSPVSQAAPVSKSGTAHAGKVKLYRKFKFPDGMYELGSSTLSSAGRKMLSEVAEQIRNDTTWSLIRVDGHTDNIGSLVYNMDLSLKRAVAVATYLVGNEGIDATKIFIKGFGKTAPIADNSHAEGRRKNRRTEVLLFSPKEA